LSAAAYDELRRSFRWELPPTLNLGLEVADLQPRDAPAILVTDGRTVTRTVTFGELSDDSNRLANALRRAGVEPGDRIGIILPQRPETAVAHVAAAKLGAIAVPLSVLFGPDGLETRLRDADVRVVLGEAEPLDRIAGLGLDVPLVDVDRDLASLLADASARVEPARTGPDTPALLVYTSGTTGPPKGALHAHRVLAGHLPGFGLSHDFFPQDGDRIWTPADWAWIGGLYDVLMPALRHGIAVVAHRGGRFDPERAFDLMAHVGVRNVFMPATALRLMRSHDPGTPVCLRTVASGGETVGAETAAWCGERLGARLNEFYGQTEANLLVGNCAAWEARPGSMGLPYPGHDVRVVDGEVCVRVEGDPVVFLGYWRNEEATAAKVRDGWLFTGDQAEQDADGYLRFVGRDDDLISSAGHRIGPGPVEECLIRHPAVAHAPSFFFPQLVDAAGGTCAVAYDWDEYAELVGPETTLAIVNTPVNPTGYAFRESDLDAIADALHDSDALLLSDEAYVGLLWDSHVHRSPAEHPALRERTLVLRSFSKTYAMAAWRVGYAVGPEAAIGALARELQWQALAIDGVAQSAALAVLTGPRDWLDVAFADLAEMRPRAIAAANEAGLRAELPEGCAFVWAAVDGDEDEWSDRLAREHRIPALPGRHFHARTPHLRIPFGGRSDAREALLRAFSEVRLPASHR
jgi:acetyl-CoA synthetase